MHAIAPGALCSTEPCDHAAAGVRGGFAKAIPRMGSKVGPAVAFGRGGRPTWLATLAISVMHAIAHGALCSTEPCDHGAKSVGLGTQPLQKGPRARIVAADLVRPSAMGSGGRALALPASFPSRTPGRAARGCVHTHDVTHPRCNTRDCTSTIVALLFCFLLLWSV